MRKLFTLLLSAMLVFVGSMALAAESCTVTEKQLTRTANSSMHVQTWTWQSKTDGSLTACAGPAAVNGWVILTTTKPGTTNPTALYDLTLTDSDSIDVMGGTLADRSATLAEQVTSVVRYVRGKLTLNLSNNSVNTAQGTVTVYIYREP